MALREIQGSSKSQKRLKKGFKNYLGVDLEGANFLQFAQGHARGPKRHQKAPKRAPKLNISLHEYIIPSTIQS